MLPGDRAAAAARRRPAHDEDDELGLPPLDGSIDERDEPAEGSAALEMAVEEYGGGADDTAASDLDPGITIDEVDDIGLDDTAAARDAVDVGAFADPPAFLDGGAPRDEDEQGLPRELDDEPSIFGLFDADDGSGTGEDPASFIDEGALPPLDVEDGAGDAEDPAHGIRVSDPGLPWDRGRWRVAAGLGAEVPCQLVAVSAGCVVAAGPALLVVRDGARVSSGVEPDIDAAAIAATDDALFAVARRGTLFVSLDGGDSWSTSTVPWPAKGGLSAIAATPGRLWVCDAGALWSLPWSRSSRPGVPVQVRREGVRSMVAAGSTLVLLSERGADLVLERLRADDEAHPAMVLPASARAAIGADASALAATAGGRAIALLAGASVLVSRDAAKTFRRFETGPALGVAFAGSGEDARAVVLTAGAGGAPIALAEGGDDGGFARVAEIAVGAPCRASIAWDAAREVLWLACPAGLIAFERATQH